MKMPPLTHNFPFHKLDEQLRTLAMAEFVAQDEPNLVLIGSLIREIMHTPSLAASLKESLKQSGARFVGAHLPFSTLENLNIPFESSWKQMVMRVELGLRIVADFGIDVAVAHVGNTPQEFAEYSVDQLTEVAIRTAEAVMPTAEEVGVNLAIENIWTPTSTPERLIQILEAVDSPWLSLCYDSGHANLMARDRKNEESTVLSQWVDQDAIQYDENILEKMLPYISIVHLHDNDGLRDQHLLPGQGEIDWKHTMRTLRKAPNLICIQNESNVTHGGSIATAMRMMREVMKYFYD
jgi:sugar phosphate isomerase/epimerase